MRLEIIAHGVPKRDGSGSHERKSIVDVPDNEARIWIKNNWARPARQRNQVEFAVTAAPEQALSRRGRGRPRKE